MRKQTRLSARATEVLSMIPRRFVDDGCSNSPDSIFGFDLRFACRIHDWRYCSRCHPPMNMRQWNRDQADRELKQNIKAALPWRWRWIGWVFRAVVHRYGGTTAWDSCGHKVGHICRHNMKTPDSWAV